MKLVWENYVLKGLSQKVLPRATLTAEEIAAGKGNLTVSLARAGEGKCAYPLVALQAHDGHAPSWKADGSAPPFTSANVSMQEYMDRVAADIKAHGLEVEVEVKMTEHETPKFDLGGEEHEDVPDADGKPKGEGWKPYGVN